MCAICQHEKVLHTACSVLEKIQTGFTEDQQLSFFGLCKSNYYYMPVVEAAQQLVR